MAIRVILHPFARKLCQKFGGSIVSTSANLAGKKPLKNWQQVIKRFSWQVDLVISGKVGNLRKPNQIRDVRTNKIIRD